MTMKTYLSKKKKTVDNWLNTLLPSENDEPKTIHKAMRYSIFAGGKRIRPILAILTAEMLGTPQSKVKLPACSLEMIHTYSLIHDDLPSMDDDDLRRGKPTNHKVFGEAMAILAGDALLTEAFVILKGLNGKYLPEILKIISYASSSRGMVGGQVLDIEATGKKIDLKSLKKIHSLKTGALLKAPILIGAVLSDKKRLRKFEKFGDSLGMLFQITDDILDETSTEKELGKPIGSDKELGKATYVSILGLKNAQKEALKVRDLCHNSLDEIRAKNKDKKQIFHEIIDYLYERRS